MAIYNEPEAIMPDLDRFIPEAKDMLIDSPSDNPLLREAQLGLAGFAGIGKAAEKAFSKEEAFSTIGKFATSAALGYVMAKAEPSDGLLGQLAKPANMGMSLGFTADILTNAKEVAGAMYKSWGSKSSWTTNVDVMQKHGGEFLFDSALMTAGGMAGHGATKIPFKSIACEHIPRMIGKVLDKLPIPNISIGFGPNQLAADGVPISYVSGSRIVEPGQFPNRLEMATLGDNIADTPRNSRKPEDVLECPTFGRQWSGVKAL